MKLRKMKVYTLGLLMSSVVLTEGQAMDKKARRFYEHRMGVMVTQEQTQSLSKDPSVLVKLEKAKKYVEAGEFVSAHAPGKSAPQIAIEGRTKRELAAADHDELEDEQKAVIPDLVRMIVTEQIPGDVPEGKKREIIDQAVRLKAEELEINPVNLLAVAGIEDEEEVTAENIQARVQALMNLDAEGRREQVRRLFAEAVEEEGEGEGEGDLGGHEGGLGGHGDDHEDDHEGGGGAPVEDESEGEGGHVDAPVEDESESEGEGEGEGGHVDAPVEDGH